MQALSSRSRHFPEATTNSTGAIAWILSLGCLVWQSVPMLQCLPWSIVENKGRDIWQRGCVKMWQSMITGGQFFSGLRLFMKLVRPIEAVCLLAAIALGYSSAEATQLIFEQVRYDGMVYSAFNDGVVPQDYGDRVTSLAQAVSGGIFTYGNLGEGFTPNVEVAYGPYAESASLWWGMFGDLTHVLWTNVYLPFDITFTADPGFLVNLLGFDLAGWANWDYVIASLQILDGSGNLLVDQHDVYVEGDFDGPRHSHFAFDHLQAETLVIRIDTRNLGGWFFNVGIDNIRFSQSEAGPNPSPSVPSSAVPEPNSALLFAAAIAAVQLRLRRQK
jgi:hypothetical protein